MEKHIDRRLFLKLLAVAVTGILADGSRNKSLEAQDSEELPTGLEIHAALSDPEFLLQDRQPRKLFTAQYDPTEYTELTFAINACGPALIATVLKIYTFLSSGTVPDITIQSVRDDLENSSYQTDQGEHSFLLWDKQMFFSSLKAAFEQYSLSYPIEITTISNIPITGYSNEGFIDSSILTPSQLETLETESAPIFRRGGMLVIFSTTYRGHFFLISNLYRDSNNNLRAVLLDSMGPTASREGLVTNMLLDDFVGDWEGELGLISAFGVYPTYT